MKTSESLVIQSACIGKCFNKYGSLSLLWKLSLGGNQSASGNYTEVTDLAALTNNGAFRLSFNFSIFVSIPSWLHPGRI